MALVRRNEFLAAVLLVSTSWAVQCSGGEETLSPAAQTALDALKTLSPAERAAVFKKFAVSQPMPPSDDVAAALKNGTDEAGKDGSEKKEAQPSRYSMHFQSTIISQKHDVIKDTPYSGPFSLQKSEDQKLSLTNTLFWGTRLFWDGGEAYINPEVSGGQGLSSVEGIAGFPNGDIEKVGKPQPTPYIARLFLRQTFNLGGESEKVEDDLNQLEGKRDVSRVIVTFGKIAATDVFDTNQFSHDPRVQFMNWSIMDYGAWDYAADVRGYAPGLTVDWNNKDWALRYGAFMVPDRANAATFDFDLRQSNSQNLEYERRYKIFGREGTVRVLAFANFAHMGSYKEAVEQAPNTEPTNGNRAATTAQFNSRAHRMKYGFGVNAEQQMLNDLGGFLRASWNDGHTETWMFTEIDRSLSLGATLKGSRWGRPDDLIGVAGVINGLSQDHEQFLSAGGNGFIVGDGKLNYALEKTFETYYSLAINKNIILTVDYQHVSDPAYNQDRGPVNVGGVRLHVQY